MAYAEAGDLLHSPAASYEKRTPQPLQKLERSMEAHDTKEKKGTMLKPVLSRQNQSR